MNKSESIISRLKVANEVFNMNVGPAKSLEEFVKNNDKNKHGEVFKTGPFSDGLILYFFPVQVQKNGGAKGVMFRAFNGENDWAGKAIIQSINKIDFSRWQWINKSDIHPKIKSKLEVAAQRLM